MAGSCRCRRRPVGGDRRRRCRRLGAGVGVVGRIRMPASDIGERPEQRHDDHSGHDCGPAPRSVVHGLERMLLGAVGAMERHSLGRVPAANAVLKARIVEDERAVRVGNSSLSRTGTGGTQRPVLGPSSRARRLPTPPPGPCHPSLRRPGPGWARRLPGLRIHPGSRRPSPEPVRCARPAARSFPMPSGTSAPSSDRCRGDAGGRQRRRPRRRSVRLRSGRSTSRLFNPKSRAIG